MAALSLLLTVLLTAISPAALAIPANSTDFIRRSCTATLYPKLCYTSLKPYAKTVKQSPLSLAIIAANVSLAKIKESVLKAEALRHHRKRRAGAALRDCVDVLRTAEDLTKQAMAEIRKLGKPAAQAGRRSSFISEVSNAQTWMSSVITNEDTCIDGFGDIGCGGGGGAEVLKGFIRKVRRVERYSSNALALLNALVEG
ncbi:21 kDa protein-like [Phalaenopsis equestris]|uniref:21 kDa protein-like n=1 Tax=Phalaenopsis equestris TaxID=78828 RepID=UPI0009E6226D|nr:21 kDa protein-like [Phalaenopsis equestris]